MAKSQPSSAPWRHYTAPLRPTFHSIIHEIHDALGSEVVKWSGFDGLGVPKSTIAANAKLIAAAPELLEALQWLYAICLRDGLLPPTVSYMQNAETAIAKATGKRRRTSTRKA